MAIKQRADSTLAEYSLSSWWINWFGKMKWSVVVVIVQG